MESPLGVRQLGCWLRWLLLIALESDDPQDPHSHWNGLGFVSIGSCLAFSLPETRPNNHNMVSKVSFLKKPTRKAPTILEKLAFDRAKT